jgi:acetyltransferase
VLALDARMRVSAARRRRGALRDPALPGELVETPGMAGPPLVLRPIRPEDEAQHLAFLERLDPRTSACACSTAGAASSAASWRG